MRTLDGNERSAGDAARFRSLETRELVVPRRALTLFSVRILESTGELVTREDSEAVSRTVRSLLTSPPEHSRRQ